jgi:predicted acylesterase/phospholipase RssA
MHGRPFAPYPLGALFVVLAAVAVLPAGCSRAYDRPLNSLKLPLEARTSNSTRAATFARVLPPTAGSDERIRPATAPSANDAGAAALPVDGDGYFVGLAISGGGSRSANFAAACMFHLQRLRLLQRVDFISSVSGGSLPAAFYCTHDADAWNPQDVQRKLTHGFANDVLVQAILPWNYFALTFTSWDRTDLLADAFRNTLFTRPGGKPMTFADLRDDRPRLLINATDLQSGRRFIFANESFDEINSDLSAFPIARAVAASSAVPVLLHHLTLKDYSTTFDQYRHLIDGAVSDNLGAETLVETFAAHVEQARRAGRGDPYPNGALILLLDATVGFDARLSHRADVSFLESLLTGAGLSTTALINRAGSATLAEMIVQNADDDTTAEQLRGAIAELKRTGQLTQRSRTGHTVHVVHIALSQVETLSNVPFASFRESVNNIATYFNIDRTEAFRLYQAAQLLIEQKHEARLLELRREMDGRGPDAG